MHLLSTTPGGFVDDSAGVVRVAQTPAEIVVMSSADTTLALLAQAYCRLDPTNRPTLRLLNLAFLRQSASVDLYVDEVLVHAKAIVVDHLGGESYWPYGIERLISLARERGQALAMFSGDLQEDPNLIAKSTLPAEVCRALWRYLREGGPRNAQGFLRCLMHQVFGLGEAPPGARALPAAAIYHPHVESASLAHWRADWQDGAPTVAVLFYKAHLQSGNTAVFDAMAEALRAHGMNPLPIAVSSLKEPVCREVLSDLCASAQVALVLNTTAFAAGAIGAETALPLAGDPPVLQAILSGANRQAWLDSEQGLLARDIAMHIALPEVDGRIITRAVSFKALAYHCEDTQVDVVHYEADPERLNFVVELARRWCRLRTLGNAQKRVALVLANYPLSEGRIGNGVGLDTPASVVGILQQLARAGYGVEAPPADGAALMAQLTQGVSNDLSRHALRPAFQSYAMQAYRERLAALPEAARQALLARWGEPEDDPSVRAGRFTIAGWRYGRVFVGIQPARSRALDSYASYHDAQLVPPHSYLAFYFWLRDVFGVDAVVHVGKHGNLEWLPGKSVALGPACWPDLALGPLPHLYPFIVNDPGEGAQAKRRAQAVIIDHLMPPLTRAENYGPLQDLERQVDEYYEALMVDARRARLLRRSILDTIVAHHLHEELGLARPVGPADEDALLTRTDAYLCELKEAQIRDGLHVFGVSPSGRQRRDTLLALARYPVGDGRGSEASLLRALAQDLGLGETFDPLDIDAAASWTGPRPAALAALGDGAWRHQGDTRERLEHLAGTMLAEVLDGAARAAQVFAPHAWPRSAAVLDRLLNDLVPRLDACGPQELAHLLDGLAGRFVPPGPSGSPSRGRPDVLPTGRNFYSVDTRAVPTRAAWELGLKSANRLIERHVQDHGDYPRAIGLSVWGTATMRTGGDDMAQALALLGVRPKWAAGSHRVTDFEILPSAVLERPRIDVTLRVSGFFRDAFPNLMHLFDAAVQAVAELDEPADINPVRARIQAETLRWQAAGHEAEAARRRAGWRVFSARPGSYGAGLQTLIDSRQWRDDADLARSYGAWGGYAYSQFGDGLEAGEVFRARLGAIDTVVQNQDNREHDLLDSNDYYQFQGGMAAAARHFGGAQPAIYHADHSHPEQPRVRTLREEIARVIRARVVNPKWLDGVRRHGYKGAAELAATVDYLFGYDATAHVVEDYQYALVADAYLGDAPTREFMQRHNPQAMRDICERLIEAMQRGMWAEAGAWRERVEDMLLDSEANEETAR